MFDDHLDMRSFFALSLQFIRDRTTTYSHLDSHTKLFPNSTDDFLKEIIIDFVFLINKKTQTLKDFPLNFDTN